MPVWANILLGISAFLGGLVVTRLLKKTDDSASKADLKELEVRLHEECKNNRGSCQGPGWMEKAIKLLMEEQKKTNLKLTELTTVLKIKGYLEPERRKI
jgi:hypothetical protein